MNALKLAAKAKAANVIDPDEAAVFVADESRRPYDVDLILSDPSTYQRCLRAAQRLMPTTPSLLTRLDEARKSLDWLHEL